MAFAVLSPEQGQDEASFSLSTRVDGQRIEGGVCGPGEVKLFASSGSSWDPDVALLTPKEARRLALLLIRAAERAERC